MNPSSHKGRQWVFAGDIPMEETAPGVRRQVLAYGEDLMLVANHFDKDAVGATHSHPHTQATYIVSGAFAFTIDGVTRVVRPGDTLLKEDGVPHGCVCLEAGTLIDAFSPMRKEFVGE